MRTNNIEVIAHPVSRSSWSIGPIKLEKAVSNTFARTHRTSSFYGTSRGGGRPSMEKMASGIKRERNIGGTGNSTCPQPRSPTNVRPL